MLHQPASAIQVILKTLCKYANLVIIHAVIAEVKELNNAHHVNLTQIDFKQL